MPSPTHSVLLNIPAPLMLLIEERLQQAVTSRAPGDFTKVTRTSVIMRLLYTALESSPEAGKPIPVKPKRIIKL